jgi:hypothetical protein
VAMEVRRAGNDERVPLVSWLRRRADINGVKSTFDDR